MLSHSEIGGRCTGKLIRQSRGRKNSRANMICNVCDMTIQEEVARRLAHKKSIQLKRKAYRETPE